MLKNACKSLKSLNFIIIGLIQSEVCKMFEVFGVFFWIYILVIALN